VEAISKCVPFIKAHAVVEFENADQFGAIRSAVLHVQGPVFKAFLGPRGHSLSKHLCKLYVTQNLGSQNNDPELVTNAPALLDISYPASRKRLLEAQCRKEYEREEVGGDYRISII
jgi:hypothetical protein